MALPVKATCSLLKGAYVQLLKKHMVYKEGKRVLGSSFAWIIYQQMNDPSCCPGVKSTPKGQEGMLNES